MNQQGLFNDATDGMAGIERFVGVLEDDLHIFAEVAHFPIGKLEQALSFEGDLAGESPRVEGLGPGGDQEDRAEQGAGQGAEDASPASGSR